MSSPSQAPAGRMSQMLPSVKCSNCNLPVPLAELGEHICAPAPPLPTLNIPKTAGLNLPKPSLSPGAAASLLPQRLQGLVGPPGASRTPPSPAQSARASGPPSNAASSRNDRLRLNTSGPTPSYPTRSSPLSRTSEGPPAPRAPSRDPYASGGESPVRNRPPVAPFGRARSGSNASSVSSPITARPSFAIRDPRDVPPAAAPPQPNTQIGGEAGMAGVGRRGFAAAARAAMFTTSPAPAPPPTARASPPRQIDVRAATIGSSESPPPLTSVFGKINLLFQETTPPPLSNSTGSSHSPGVAPYPESPVSPQLYSRRSRSPQSQAPKAQLKSTASVSSRSSESNYGGLAYADSTDYEDDEDDDDADLRRVNERFGSFAPKSPLPPKSDSSASNKPRSNAPEPTRGGPSNERSRERAPLRDATSESGSSEAGGLKRNNSARVAQAFGLSQTPPSGYGRLGGPGMTPASRNGGHSRGSSSGSAQSAYSSKSPIVAGSITATPSGGRSGSGNGKLEREMDSDTGRPGLAKSRSTRRDRSLSPVARRKDLAVEDDRRSVRSGRSDRSPDSSRTPKATRSRTSPSRERSSTREDPKRERAARKPKICIRCEKKIDDGKWVAMDGGGVLCEKCWKNMYLPKCRRCNLPIEKQAVSSSDGQLKGKYHRECFNCHTCHKPFPDKTFYVLDSKPLCAYHYHEANDSLCAAARCGQPIEGPCAVSHAGDRYHPEHMLCEFPGYGGCKEKLDEYWEIDGRMLCERHSRMTREDQDEDDEDWARNARAKKRTTRYIDLANAGPVGGRR
ncbi:hypothetical protein C8F04DRAFT_1247985 [Mycena alexandri]|uniref:LIM zinc-binding domain-containing protein n=1 Tax=Mycena alexandri TaxID=1745969 RepID=A0AAD6TMK4_9AGAR|nr:hypothetical protein C8F04DRAFT_1247985 [Mycena alexandri]